MMQYYIIHIQILSFVSYHYEVKHIYIYSTIQDTLLLKHKKQNKTENNLPKILVIIAEHKLKYVISEV